MPVSVGKSSLKDKLEDNTLDLSLMQMDEVPVEELAMVPKGTTVDLSNNLLMRLPENFPTLTHIIKLDLSKNRLEELPEYFGQMTQLRHLDLYSNQITRLPVSFCQLRNLKWLDLKGNPLVPALQQAAGPCITASDCSACAKRVVGLMREMSAQMETERQRIAMAERKKEELRMMAENAERDRVRAEKKAAKAANKKGNKGTNSSNAANTNNGGSSGDGRFRGSPSSTPSSVRNGGQHSNGRANARGGNTTTSRNNQVTSSKTSNGGGSFCWSLMLVMLSLVLFSAGAALSTLWIYTGGRLDQNSIERALPVITRDAEALASKASLYIEAFNKDYLAPFWASTLSKLEWLGSELERRHKLASYWMNENLGPTFCEAKKQATIAWGHALTHLQQVYEKSKPFIKDLQFVVTKYADVFRVHALQFLETVYRHSLQAYDHLQASLHNLLN